MRSIGFAGIAAVSFLFVAGCGGGTGSGGPTLTGTLVSRDGSSANLDGVSFECPDTGSADVTDGSGKFSLDVPAGTTFRVTVKDPEAQGKGKGGEDCPESDDKTGDKSDIAGDEVELEGLEDGESCDIEVEIEDGEIVGIHVSKDGKDGGGESGEGVLHAEDGSDAYGEVEVAFEDGCSSIEVEFAGLLPETPYVLTIADASGVEAVLADFVTNAAGEGHIERETCGDAPLAFGISDVRELAGFMLILRDLEENVILVGEVPTTGTHDADKDDEKDDEKDGDEDGKDEEKDGKDEEKDGEGEDGVK